MHEHTTNDGNISPLRLDFDAPSCTESLFSLFQICPISAKLDGQKPPELSPMGVYGSTTTKGERFRKHRENVTTKVSTNVTNMLPSEGPPKGFFCCFLGPHPQMVSKALRTGSKTQKHVKMEAFQRILCCFVSSISYSLEAFWR